MLEPVVIDADEATGRAVSITRLSIRSTELDALAAERTHTLTR